MGVEHMGDLHAFIPGNGEVILYVTLRVDDGHGFGAGAADHIGKATHAVNGNLVEIHSLLLYQLSEGPGSTATG
jgi:hypothetical protein